MADISKAVPEIIVLFKKKLHFFFQRVEETSLALAYSAKQNVEGTEWPVQKDLEQTFME